jgi:Fe-S cluster assembly iron-binding protein IscA
MLAVAQGAVEVIKGMVEDDDDASAEAGLRIDVGQGDEEGVELALDFVDGPGEGDATVEHDGVRVYLTAEAAALLDDKVLDAQAHGDHAHFSIEEQAA